MRVVVAVVLLAVACGRIGFDQQLSAQVAAANSCSACPSMTVEITAPAESSLVAYLATCGPAASGCTIPALTDTLGNTWSGPIESISTNSFDTALAWYACNARSGDDVVTATGTGSFFMALHVVAFDSTAADCIEASGAATGSGGSASVGTTMPVTATPAFATAFYFGRDATGIATPWMTQAGLAPISSNVAPFRFHSTIVEGAEVTVAGPIATTATDGDPVVAWTALAVVLAPR